MENISSITYNSKDFIKVPSYAIINYDNYCNGQYYIYKHIDKIFRVLNLINSPIENNILRKMDRIVSDKHLFRVNRPTYQGNLVFRKASYNCLPVYKLYLGCAVGKDYFESYDCRVHYSISIVINTNYVIVENNRGFFVFNTKDKTYLIVKGLIKRKDEVTICSIIKNEKVGGIYQYVGFKPGAFRPIEELIKEMENEK